MQQRPAKDYSVIAFDHNMFNTFGANLPTFSHELLHAQFFSSAKIRAVVDQFWNSLSKDRQDTIRDDLNRTYDVDRERDAKHDSCTILYSGDSVKMDVCAAERDYLLKNEFYAYSLQFGAASGRALLSATEAQAFKDLLIKNDLTLYDVEQLSKGTGLP